MTPIPPDAADRIAELAPIARGARRQHLPTDPRAVASREFTEILKELHEQGCTVRSLAEVADMTYHSIAARIRSDG